jgi:hypothetical protein
MVLPTNRPDFEFAGVSNRELPKSPFIRNYREAVSVDL